jgi:multidrug efflux pump subunit AcrB
VNISVIAIRRPVFTVMVTVAMLVLGAVGFTRLGTDLFPDVSFPAVAVTVPYPGASPSEVENLVTKPLEDAVVSLNGIDRVRTFSREGTAICKSRTFPRKWGLRSNSRSMARSLRGMPFV